MAFRRAIKALTLGALTLVCLSSVFTSTAALDGCTIATCNFAYSFFDINQVSTANYLENGMAWESSSIEATWLPFSGQQAYDFMVQFPANARPTEILAFISTESMPNNINSQFALAAGNLAETRATYDHDIAPDSKAWKVFVHNDTCGDYVVRLLVRASVEGGHAPAPTTDAGAADVGVGPFDAAGAD